jgi:hypothetical protein
MLTGVLDDRPTVIRSSGDPIRWRCLADGPHGLGPPPSRRRRYVPPSSACDGADCSLVPTGIRSIEERDQVFLPAFSQYGADKLIRPLGWPTAKLARPARPHLAEVPQRQWACQVCKPLGQAATTAWAEYGGSAGEPVSMPAVSARTILARPADRRGSRAPLAWSTIAYSRARHYPWHGRDLGPPLPEFPP